MPAETHQLRDDVDVAAVLELLASHVGVDPAEAAELRLDTVGLRDDLALLDLWEVAAEEFGERSTGELDLDDERPATLGELATVFAAALGR